MAASQMRGSTKGYVLAEPLQKTPKFSTHQPKNEQGCQTQSNADIVLAIRRVANEAEAGRHQSQ